MSCFCQEGNLLFEHALLSFLDYYKKSKMNVSKYKFNGSGKCSSSRGIEEVCSVLNLNWDCKNHLKSLKLLHQYEECQWMRKN